MYSFEYQKAASLADASAALLRDADSRPLAGGQSLIAAMKLRLSKPVEVVDLSPIAELRGIRVEPDAVTIGAMMRHAEVAASPEVNKAIPALASLAAGIGDRMVRNMGTCGGSVANNDPAADYPAGCVALGASIITNRRSISADDFFKGLYETALEQGELITAIRCPIPKRASYMKFKNPASRYAIVGVFIADFGHSVRVAVTGAGPGVFRVPEMEQALGKSFTPEAVANIKVSDKDLNSDLHAKADYRAHLITVMARRGVQVALDGAKAAA